MPHTRGPESQREMLSLVTARVRDAYVRKPFYVDGTLDLVSVCRELSAQGLTSALVNDGERLGIFTTTDLRDALLRETPPAQLAVREVARFGLIEVDADAELFEALWLMVRHRVHRLLVRDGGAVLGLLGQLDLVSFVANHSHIVAVQIDEATSIEELAAAARRVDALVELLQDGGIKIERIARLVNELNQRLFARAWSLIAPSEIVENSCLLVMGSEGRGEQILKTDQDNALLLRDGFEFAGLAAVTQAFNQALIEFGWPPCPGDIMLTNAAWCAPLAAFRERIRGWIYGSDAVGPMHLAIFMDAATVAGDDALLQQARQFVHDILPDNQAFLARFAGAITQFQEPTAGWWARLTGQRGRDDAPFDVKKLGLFPIVHGVRSLALQSHVAALGTGERLHALVEARQLDADLARDLLEALHFLMGLRLKNHLAQRALGQPASNLLRLSSLSTLERDRLQDSLGIVKRLRQQLQQHFHLGAL